MKTTVRSSTARSQQILKMTCLRFSLIKLKCENHTQMSVGQFGFWPYALLSGFYGIFYVFKRQFLVGGWACRESKLFFPCRLPTYTLEKPPSLFERKVSSLHAPTKQGLFIEPGSAKSFSHSHKQASALPSVPFSVLAISLSLSLFSSVSL